VQIYIGEDIMDRNFIDSFTQDILVKAGLDDIPHDFKATYVKQLSYELRKRIGILAVTALDAESYLDFQKLVKDNPNQDLFCVIDFFQARLPNFHEIVAQALFEFEREIIEQANQIKFIAY